MNVKKVNAAAANCSVYEKSSALMVVGDKSIKCNSYAYFRSYVRLSETKQFASIKIFAYDLYDLYVNGVEIGTGPSPGSSTVLYYDTWNITNQLHEGDNLIAVKVHYNGVYSAAVAKECGLLCELEIVSKGRKTFYLQQPEEWRCAPAKAYSRETSKNVGRVGYSERYSFEAEEELWYLETFDDQSFAMPKIGSEIPACYWNARSIPLFKMVVKKPEWVRVQQDGSFLADFGSFVFGRVAIRANLFQTGKIKVAYVEDLASGWAVTLGQAEMYFDEISATAGEMGWRSFNKRGFRYLRLTGPCDVNEVYVEEVNYPCLPTSSFESSDPELNAIWDLSAKTLRICLDDIYNDCPHRDRDQWMDAFVSSKVAFSLYGIKSLTRKCLIQHGICSFHDGKMFSPSISGEMWLPDYSLVYIRFLLWYFQTTGDGEILKLLFDGANGILEHFKNYLDTDDLLVDVERDGGFLYLDNSFELQRKRKSTALNALYYGALSAMSKMSAILGRDKLADDFCNQAAKVKETFRNVFPHPDIDGCYVDAQPQPSDKAFLNINFSCEWNAWCGHSGHAVMYLYAEDDKAIDIEYAAYAGLRIRVNDNLIHDRAMSPNWNRQPIYAPKIISLPVHCGWNKLDFEVEGNDLHWELFFREVSGEELKISYDTSTLRQGHALIEEIEWSTSEPIENGLPRKTVRFRSWTPPILSQTTHGYVAFSGLCDSQDDMRQMLKKTIPENAYYRNYRRIREPFFSTEAEVPNWILPCNTPWSAFFYISSLFDCGLSREAMAWIRMAWGGMLRQGAVNCWEEWTSRASLCHAWGSSPAFFFHRYILGVNQESLYRGVLVVEPDLMDLEWAEGTIALDETSGLLIHVELRRNDQQTDVKIQVPDSLQIEFNGSKLKNPQLIY